MTSDVHNINDLIALFDQTFSESHNTRLIRGEHEPVYLPADNEVAYHRIIFAHGYFASALHEIAHWCIAGAERRLLEDFGYWYRPDGRNQQEQQQFEQVEIKPQAVEWALSVAAGKKFNVSADNLNGAEADTDRFKHNVYQQVLVYLQQGFPARAQQFIEVLAAFYHIELPLSVAHFNAAQEQLFAHREPAETLACN